jgi:hypothetical protein
LLIVICIAACCWCLVLGAGAWCSLLVARCPLPSPDCICCSTLDPVHPSLSLRHATPRTPHPAHLSTSHLITLHPLTHTQHSPMSIPSHMHPGTSPTNPLVRHRLALRRTQFHRRLPDSVVACQFHREPPNSIVNHRQPPSSSVDNCIRDCQTLSSTTLSTAVSLAYHATG